MNFEKFAALFISAGFLISCSRETCQDGELNQNETSIDCGGVCTICQTCYDGEKNGNELDVDCGGDCQPCKIAFPDSGNYGTNLLAYDVVNVTPGSYSLSAQLMEGSHFSVSFRLISGDTWSVVSGTSTNMVIGDLESDISGIGQQFRATGFGAVDLNITLSGTGSASLLYMENKGASSFQKSISW